MGVRYNETICCTIPKDVDVIGQQAQMTKRLKRAREKNNDDRLEGRRTDGRAGAAQTGCYWEENQPIKAGVN
jgi:hypothetical protein